MKEKGVYCCPGSRSTRHILVSGNNGVYFHYVTDGAVLSAWKLEELLHEKLC